MTHTKKLTISALFIALYLVLMYFNQAFAYGPMQVRLATALYGLTWIYPFLIIPSGIANMLSNILFGGLGLADIIGGGLIGLLTSSGVYLLKKFNFPLWAMILPIIFIPGIGVPLYLHVILNVPLLPLIASLILGQFVAALISFLFIRALKTRLR